MHNESLYFISNQHKGQPCAGLFTAFSQKRSNAPVRVGRGIILWRRPQSRAFCRRSAQAGRHPLGTPPPCFPEHPAAAKPWPPAPPHSFHPMPGPWGRCAAPWCAFPLPQSSTPLLPAHKRQKARRRLPSGFFHVFYLAYSMARVSRMTCTLIWPG